MLLKLLTYLNTKYFVLRDAPEQNGWTVLWHWMRCGYGTTNPEQVIDNGGKQCLLFFLFFSCCNKSTRITVVNPLHLVMNVC